MILIRIAVLFMLITNLQTWGAEKYTNRSERTSALKIDQAPTIDGVLDDVCWQDAPQATGFTDERTEKRRKTIGRSGRLHRHRHLRRASSLR